MFNLNHLFFFKKLLPKQAIFFQTNSLFYLHIFLFYFLFFTSSVIRTIIFFIWSFEHNFANYINLGNLSLEGIVQFLICQEIRKVLFKFLLSYMGYLMYILLCEKVMRIGFWCWLFKERRFWYLYTSYGRALVFTSFRPRGLQYSSLFWA